MGIYIFLLLFLMFFSFIQIQKIDSKLYKPYVFIGIVLVLVVGLRYGLETDYFRYYRMFNESSEALFRGSVYDTTEPGFAIFIIIVRTIYNDYNFFLLIIAIISIWGKMKVFQNYPYCFVILLLYYLRFFTFMELNAIRQGVATVFVLFAIKCILESDTKGFIVFTVIATLIHSVCFFVLVVYFFKKIKPSFKLVTFMIAFAVIFRLYLIEPFLEYGMKYADLMNSSNRLISSVRYLLNAQNTENLGLMQCVRIILPVYCFLIVKKDKKQEYLFNIYLVGSVLNIAFLGFDTIAFRLAMVFVCVEGILMGLSIKNNPINSKANSKIIVCFSLIFACDLYTFVSTMINSETMVPYRTILFN